MKKKDLLEIVFYLPVVILLCFYAFVGTNMSGPVQPVTWVIIVIMILSGYFMSNGKLLGCLLGILIGAVYAVTGITNQNRLPYEINEAPIGAAICLYYAICGLICLKNKNAR